MRVHYDSGSDHCSPLTSVRSPHVPPYCSLQSLLPNPVKSTIRTSNKSNYLEYLLNYLAPLLCSTTNFCIIRRLFICIYWDVLALAATPIHLALRAFNGIHQHCKYTLINTLAPLYSNKHNKYQDQALVFLIIENKLLYM